MNEFAGADVSHIVLHGPEGYHGMVAQRGFDPDLYRAYTEHFRWDDVLFERFAAASRLHSDWIGTRQSVISDGEFHRSASTTNASGRRGCFITAERC